MNRLVVVRAGKDTQRQEIGYTVDEERVVPYP
jgi:hypothetical protein